MLNRLLSHGGKEYPDESDPVSIPRLYNSTEPFQVYTEASDKHLGATVVQDSKLLDLYTRETESYTIVLYSGS